MKQVPLRLFRRGDLAMLKSGCPVMTVVECGDNWLSGYNCVCAWIDSELKPARAKYDEICLVKVENE